MGWKASFVALEFVSFQVDNVGAVIGTIAAGLATAYGIYIKTYEGSFKQQLDDARRRIEANSLQLAELSAENGALKVEREALLGKIEERDATIALRDAAIRQRDEAIRQRDRTNDELQRINRRMGGDVADLAEAFLIRKGDAKSRAIR